MKFTKMHGLGNDFILVEASAGGPRLTSSRFARAVCDRHQGIGADGLVVVSRSDKADCRMTIINSDGTEAQSCGNALRCVAHFAHQRSYGSGKTLSIETLAGIQVAHIMSPGEYSSVVQVDMGHPLLAPADFPATVTGPGPILAQEVATDYGTYRVALIRVGVPHAIIFVDELTSVDLVREGRALERHPAFIDGANVNFVQQVGENHFAVRVWERGAGETMACGTGACAVAVAAILLGKAGNDIRIALPGGDLSITWVPGEGIHMLGPAVEVFSGEYRAEVD